MQILAHIKYLPYLCIVNIKQQLRTPAATGNSGTKIMKTFAQYSKEVLTVVMSNLKNGVSGSTIADMMVSNYGFEREAALTIITGTILMLNKANLL